MCTVKEKNGSSVNGVFLFTLFFFFLFINREIMTVFLCWECGVSAEPQVVRPVTIGHFAHWPHTKSDAVHKFKQRDGTKAFKLYSSLFVQLGFFFFLSIFVVVYVSVYSLGSQCVFWLFRHIPVTLSGSGLFSLVNIQLLDLLCSTLFFFFFHPHTPSSLFFFPSLSLTESVLSTVCWAVHSMSTGHRSSVHHFPKGPFFLSLGCQWIGCFISFLVLVFFFFSSVWIFLNVSISLGSHLDGWCACGGFCSITSCWQKVSLTSGAAGGMDTAQAQLSVNSCVCGCVCVRACMCLHGEWCWKLVADDWSVTRLFMFFLVSIFFFFLSDNLVDSLIVKTHYLWLLRRNATTHEP